MVTMGNEMEDAFVNVKVTLIDGKVIDFTEFKNAYIDDNGNAFLMDSDDNHVTINKSQWAIFMVTAA